MTDSFLRWDQDGPVAIITFDRPDALNAFTRAMAKDFIALIERADTDDTVRAVIVTGAGRAFCAGADLKAKALAPVDDGDRAAAVERDFGGLVTLRMFDALKPVLFAINGPAAGMGVTMALAADIRMASTTAKFALPFVRRGIVPESASAWFLPRIVGIARALEWMMRGGSFGAEEALQGGLVRSLHAPEELMPAALELARDIADNASPVSVAMTRQMLWRMLSADHPMDAHRIESHLLHARKRGADVGEGISSFLEKRQPHFPDSVSKDMPEGFPWWDSPSFD
jgi:enoyl-CoA hydratase/carnithine racemase